MRYRLLATFQGAPYEAGVGPDESDVVLFAACPPPEELRFEPATGHWRKRVGRAEVQTLYESRPVGMFRGERCIVLDDLTDRLHIAYFGHDALKAEQLGYWEVDRSVFELIAPRQEVTDIVEQRLPVPARGDSGSHQHPAQAAPAQAAPGQPVALGQPAGYGPAMDAGPGPDPREHSYPGPGHDGLSSVPAVTGYLQQQRNGMAPEFRQGAPLVGLAGTDPERPGPGDPARVAVPVVDEAPLPLEAQALRAATTASRRAPKGPQSRSAAEPRPRRAATAASEPAAPALAVAPAVAVAPGQIDKGVPDGVQVPHAMPQSALPAGLSQSVGLSDPPIAAQSKTENSVATMPSWTPQIPVPVQAQVPAQSTAPEQSPGPQQSTASSQTPAPQNLASPQHRLSSPVPVPPSGSVTATDLMTVAAPAQHQPDPQVSAPFVAPAADSGQAADPELSADSDGSATLDEKVGHAARVSAGTAPASPAQPAPPQASPVHSDPAQAERSQAQPAQAQPAQAQPARTQPAQAQAEVQPPPADTPAHAGPAHARSTQAGPGISEPVTAKQVMPETAQAAQGLITGAPSESAQAQPQVAAPQHTAAQHTAPQHTAPQPSAPEPAEHVQAEATHAAPTHTAPTHTAHVPSLPGYAGPEALYPPGQVAPQAPAPVVNGTATTPAYTLAAQPEQPEQPEQPQRRRRASRRRLPTQRIFSDLATQAGIPAAAYAVGEDVDGAMCLVRTNEGFEVFNSAGGARHEVRVFQDEESAYFYLFGVLVAEAVRTGTLAPT